MKRLDTAIKALKFDVVESIMNKSQLYVDKKSIAFNIRTPKEMDLFISLGNSRYCKVGRIITKIVKEAEKFIAHLEVVIEKPELLERQYWWQS